MTEEVHVIQEPKIVQQILQKVLAGDRSGGININIFIIYNNDGQFGSNNGAKHEVGLTPVEKIEGTWFGKGIEKYHISEGSLRQALIDSSWSISRAAKLLQIPRYVVRARCERWNIRSPENPIERRNENVYQTEEDVMGKG